MTKRATMPPKDPDAYLDYKFDWAPATNQTPGGAQDWLAPGETITSYVLTLETGIDVDNDGLADANTSVSFWANNGTDKTNYSITCHITTSAGREDERTIIIPVANR